MIGTAIALRVGRIALIAALPALLVPVAAGAQGKPPAPPSPAPGRTTLRLTLPGPGDYCARYLPGPGAAVGKRQDPVSFRDAQTTLEYSPDALGNPARIAIDDVKTGNTAIRDLTGPRAPVGDRIELKRLDFDRVHRVVVRVTSGGKPVRTGTVEIKPISGALAPIVLDPGMRGEAAFSDVAAGKARLLIGLGSAGNETRDIEIVTDRQTPEQFVDAAVSAPVPTLDMTASAPGGAASAPAAQPAPGGTPVPAIPDTGSPLNTLLSTLIGVALVGSVIYALLRWARSGGMAATLKKAGIEVEGPRPDADESPTPAWSPKAPPAPVVADPSLCQFCGERRDAGGGCACGVAAGPPVAAGASVPQRPRIVGSVGVYAGRVFPLDPGGATVGRDPSCAVALPDDTTVSRRHATLSCSAGAWRVADDSSANGVFVNGVRISGSRDLHTGDDLQIGNTRFRFELG